MGKFTRKKGPKKDVSTIVDVTKKQPRRTDITENIVKLNDRAIIKDIERWRRAVLDARRIDERASRRDLIDIYEDVNDDGHVTGIVESIKNKIKAKDFEVVDSAGNPDENSTALLERQWFFKYIDFVIEAPFWGYTLIQLGDIVDDGFPFIEDVPREYVVPEEEIVIQDLHIKGRSRSIASSATVYEYTSPTFRPWFIFVGSSDQKNLGLFNKAAPYTISKRGVFAQAWAYAEIFGQPIRLGKTDISDPMRKRNMERMLESMGSSSWGVFNNDDELELVQASNADSMEVFSEPIKLNNEEISKAFAGGTGMFDEKAFVGSVEVQERLFMEFIRTFMRTVKFSINDQLIPRMIAQGMLPEGSRFKWLTEESNTAIEKAAMIASLAPFFQFDPEDVETAVGLKILGSAEAAESVMEAVAMLYEKTKA